MNTTETKSTAATRTYLDGALSKLKELLRGAQSRRKTTNAKASVFCLQLLERRCSALRDLMLYGSSDLVSPGHIGEFDDVIEFFGKECAE